MRRTTFTSAVRARVRRAGSILLGPLLLVGLGACAANGAAALPGSLPDISAGDQVYVSIGDSYAAGYQPHSATSGSTSRAGFAYQVVAKAAMGGTMLRLINFGCVGETTTQIVSQNGCQAAALGPGAPQYPTSSQAAAAISTLKAHASSVKLVTIVMGGNDVTPCLRAANPRSCLEKAIPTVERNVSGVVTAVRAAVGPAVKIVGLTYFDPYLGEYVKRTPAAIKLAAESRVMFQNYLNPALRTAYTKAGAEFVDMTQVGGAYGSMSQTTTLAPWGTLPVPVARTCQLTFYCQYQDPHPTTAGYSLVADRVLRAAS